MIAEALEKLHAELTAQVTDGLVPGLAAAVVSSDEVDVFVAGALEAGGERAVGRDTIFRIASLSKPMVAFGALQMVQEGLFELDEPVGRLVPELAHPRVLRSLDGPVSDTVAAERPITVRDLLTFTAGLGIVMAPPKTYPIQAELAEVLGEPGPPQPASALPPDETLARLGALPLLYQPGAQWAYDTAADVLGVLMARAAGTSLGTALSTRLFGPLGMVDTGFSVPPANVQKLTSSYTVGPDGGLELFDPAEGSQWASPPPLESASGGLVSTLDDLLVFARLMLGRGVLDHQRLLSDELFTAMTSDQLTAAQKSRTIWAPGFFDTHGWGFGLAVRTVAGDGESAGSYGWTGGLGTVWACDPVLGTAGILLSQRAMMSPEPESVTTSFWAGLHAATR